MIRILSPQTIKCYRNPFFGCFELPKGYGRHPNRFIGKVKFFGLNWTNKKCRSCHFCSGGALKALHPQLVGLMKSSSLKLYVIDWKCKECEAFECIYPHNISSVPSSFSWLLISRRLKSIGL